ncbi:MAG: hypothetical protein ABJB12_06205 [Pseudomonadota bacterium]
MRQETLTVVARVGAGVHLSALHAALKALSEDALPGAGARPRLFAHAELRIHFARLALLEEPPGSAYAPLLVLESNFDTEWDDAAAARKAHLELLCSTVGGPLLSAFEYCAGFGPELAPPELARALERNLALATAAYQGHTLRDLGRIRLEQRLRDVLLDFCSAAPQSTPRELYHAAREHVRLLTATDPLLAGLNLDAPMPPLPSAVARTLSLNEGYWAWIKNLSFGLIVFVLRQLRNILRWQKSDPQFEQRAEQEAWTNEDRCRFIEIADTEDHALQNALTHIVPLKDANRLAVLLAAHGYIDVMAKRYFDDIGQLGGIPSIHFAKWLLIDDNQRLMFLTNYDSSWESYLGDFVDHAPVGLNLAWVCTHHYPRTALLVFFGATDEERFKAWSRAHQRPTQVFYTAYPELSIAALNNNTWIRCGLHHAPGAIDLRAWFRRIT